MIRRSACKLTGMRSGIPRVDRMHILDQIIAFKGFAGENSDEIEPEHGQSEPVAARQPIENIPLRPTSDIAIDTKNPFGGPQINAGCRC